MRTTCTLALGQNERQSQQRKVAQQRKIAVGTIKKEGANESKKNYICLSVADGTAAGRMTNVCYFKHTEISTCLVGRPTDAWSGQTRPGRGTVETVPSFPTEQLQCVATAHVEEFSSYKKEIRTRVQPSSEEKLSFPHGDLRIAVPDPPSLQERGVETKVGHGGAVPSRTLKLGPHAGTAIVGRTEFERTRTTCML